MYSCPFTRLGVGVVGTLVVSEGHELVALERLVVTEGEQRSKP